MVNTLHIENLKSISELNIKLTNLNLLIGTNSSGKSTIIQSLLLLAQNSLNKLGVQGELISLGSVAEAHCCYERKRTIKVTVANEENEAILEVNDRGVSVEGQDYLRDNFNFYEMKIQYLSCCRIGPQVQYAKCIGFNDIIGTNGEYAIAYLNKHAYDVLDKDLCKYKNDYTLLGQVNYWLKEMMQISISTEEIPGTDSVKAIYKNSFCSNIRPTNIGAGVSYLVSILIMCLASADNGMILIENPEIHLHPSAQDKVCEFLYFIANRNRQIIIETHSDHIFDGFRARLARNEIDFNKINMYFTYLENNKTTKAMPVKIGKMGKVLNQRKDLFDQFDINLNRMLGF